MLSIWPTYMETEYLAIKIIFISVHTALFIYSLKIKKNKIKPK